MVNVGVLGPWIVELVKHMTADARRILRTADLIFGRYAATSNSLSAQQRANQPSVAPPPPGVAASAPFDHTCPSCGR